MNLKDCVADIEEGLQNYDGTNDDAAWLAIEKLNAALSGGQDLIDHIMGIEETDDAFLFKLFQLIGGYIADAARTDNLTDGSRVQLTGICESVLEALSSAPVALGDRPVDVLASGDDDPEIVSIAEERLKKLEAVLAKTVSTLLFVLKYAIKRESLPGASRHAAELESEARKAGIRGWT